MKHLAVLSLFSMSVFMYSCGSTEEAESKTENSPVVAVAAEAGAEIDSVEKKQVILEKDPRKIGPAKPASQRQIEDNIYKINAAESPLYGYWVGAFGKNKINIALAYADKDSIFGHSVCAGNFRAIKGTLKESGPGVYNITMFEPGDDQYDGEFTFTIDIDKKELTGTWKPYKPTVSAKEYTLQKRTFRYDPSVGEFPEASLSYLQVPDVENLLPEEIELIRNEIYARHGYSFTNLKIRRIFDAKDWYIPMGVDIRDQLTDKEAHNIDLLYNYEDYYEEYYNDFGR